MHPVVDGHFDFSISWLLCILLQWIRGAVVLLTADFASFGFAISRSGIPGFLHGSLLNLLRNLFFFFFFLYTMAMLVYSLTSSVLGSPVLRNPAPLSIAHLTVLSWYLTVVLICVSFKFSDAGHLLMYLLATCVSSFEKCLSGPIAPLCMDVYTYTHIFYVLWFYLKHREYDSLHSLFHSPNACWAVEIGEGRNLELSPGRPCRNQEPNCSLSPLSPSAALVQVRLFALC